VVVGVPVTFAALFEFAADYGLLPLLLAAGLATLLYTRPTVRKTVAAAVYGVGGLLVWRFLLELSLNATQGRTEPLAGAATRVLWRAIARTALVALGLRIRRGGR
jgi:hypothetical protein